VNGHFRTIRQVLRWVALQRVAPEIEMLAMDDMLSVMVFELVSLAVSNEQRIRYTIIPIFWIGSSNGAAEFPRKVVSTK
jgi:hypothetical protein